MLQTLLQFTQRYMVKSLAYPSIKDPARQQGESYDYPNNQDVVLKSQL